MPNFSIRVFAAILWLIGVRADFAQTSVLTTNVLDIANLYQPDSTYATRSIVPVNGEEFTRAVRVVVRKRPANPWEVQLNVPIPAAVATSDTLVATFYFRTATDQSAVTEFVFEKASANYDQSANRVGTEDSGAWTKVQVAFKPVAAYAARGSQINLRLGYAIQTIDFAGLTLTNYGASKQPSDFPVEITYPGQGDTAPWRVAAAERIEQIRKSELTIQLRDANGSPLANTSIHVRQVRHQFGFGTAVSSARLLNAGADRARYQGVSTQLFNRVVLENDLKWPDWEANPALATSAVNWFNARGIPVRGHNLIWPSWRWMPANVQALASNPNALRDRINRHFTNELTAMRGKLIEWDVINEPWTEKDVMNVLGNAEMVAWLKIAESLDPNTRRFVNDYGNVELAGLSDSHAEGFWQILKTLVDAGAPLGGIGLQGHFKEYLSGPTAILAMLDHFAEFGRPLAITELDVDVSDRDVQAAYTRDLLTTFFSHPAVDSIMFWGFWEGSHWRPNAALFNRNFTMRPNGVAYSNLVLQAWWTDTNVLTGTDGSAKVRGFKGDYEIMVGETTNSFKLSTNSIASLTVDRPARSLKVRQIASGIEVSWPAAITVESSDSLSSPLWSPLEPTASAAGIASALLVPHEGTRFIRPRRAL